ncbi:uncharacterized protein LOC110087181 isoform X2 [Pogona vitticeps]
MVPKNSLMGPFRGHMSIKSSPFSPGSSCKLSSQYIIQDHMAMHYRKLLSAKAAVDSSAPKSLNMSIKYGELCSPWVQSIPLSSPNSKSITKNHQHGGQIQNRECMSISCMRSIISSKIYTLKEREEFKSQTRFILHQQSLRYREYKSRSPSVEITYRSIFCTFGLAFPMPYIESRR